MMVSNRRLVTTEGPDFYPTPAWGTRALLAYIKFDGEILEPCCGDGAMAEVIEAAGYYVLASDIHDRGYGDVLDVFRIKERHTNLVTNPPFNIAEDLLAHAMRIIDQKICLLLRTAFLESARRWRKFYSMRPPYRLLVFSERLSMYPHGHDVKGGGTTSYSWFCWDMSKPPMATEITWIRPGLKE